MRSTTFLLAVLAALMSPLRAGVDIKQNLASAPLSNLFPEPVTLITGIPGHSTTGATISSKTMVSQTFTPGRDFTLGAIYFTYSTSAPGTFAVRLQAVSEGKVAETYAESPDLFPEPLTFGLESTEGAIRSLKLELTDSSRIPLKQGVTYALEVSSTDSKLNLFRRGVGVYSGGAFYANRVSAAKKEDTRDLAMGLLETDPPKTDIVAGSTFLPVPENFCIQILDENITSDGDKDLVAAAGFKNFRKGFYWNKVETQKGTYDFVGPGYDAYLTGLSARGLTPMVTLFGGNTLYGEKERSVVTEEGRKGFANFAAAVAAKYPQVKYFEIWNEPDHKAFWDTPPSEEAYAALAAVVAPAIKAVRPDAIILGPGVAGPGIPYDWVEQAFQHGLLEHVDAVTVHPYPINGGNTPPEYVLAEYVQLRNYIEQYAPKGKKIDIVSGEWGYHSDETPNGVSFEKQAQYAARMFLLHLSLGMPLQNWFTWKDGTWSLRGVDNFGLLRFDGKEIKPSYHALKNLATTLKGFRFQNRLDLGDPGTFGLEFVNDAGARAFALWTIGDDAPVQFPLPAGKGQLISLDGSSQAPLSWDASGPKLTATGSPQYLLVD